MENKKQYTVPASEVLPLRLETNICSYQYSGSTINNITEKDMSGGWQ
jgi:hypothetical protein